MERLSTIRVTGTDATAFLQGQLTNDLRKLGSGRQMLAAWCNPKGRVIWFGTISATEDGYELSVPTEIAADVVRRMTMFRFRSKVEFAQVDDAASVDPQSLILEGRAYIGSAQMEKFTPHMLNLDLLDAISLDKGCYTGQEIVARTHYKGATKRRALRFESAAPVAVGDKVSLGDRDIGEVLNAADNDLLAVVPLDKADEALTVNGIALTRKALPYL